MHILDRLQGNWNSSKAGLKQGQILMLWPMLCQLLNIMMLLVALKDSMLLLIMH